MDLQICIGWSRHSECGVRASTTRRQAPCMVCGLTRTRFGRAIFVTMASCSAVLGLVVQVFADRTIFLGAQKERIGRVTHKLWRAWVREGLEVPQSRGVERVLCPSEQVSASSRSMGHGRCRVRGLTDSGFGLSRADPL